MIHSGYFILAATLVCGVGIKDGNIILCYHIPKLIRDEEISTIGYNYKIVFGFFNITLTVYCGIPDFNPPPIPIDDSSHPGKIAHYTPDPLTYALSFAYENSVSNLNTPCDFPNFSLLTSDSPATEHIMMRNKNDSGISKRVYLARHYD